MRTAGHRSFTDAPGGDPAPGNAILRHVPKSDHALNR